MDAIEEIESGELAVCKDLAGSGCSYADWRPVEEKAQAELLRLAKAGLKYEKVCRELEKLTPGGSEFHADPNNCIDWIKYKINMQYKMIMRKGT